MSNIIVYEFDNDIEIRYPSIIIHNDKEYLFYNFDNHVFQKTNLIVNNEIKEVLKNYHSISHNFTIFSHKDYKFFYGIGGQYKMQNPYIQNYRNICKENNIQMKNCKNKGLYLLKSNDLINWEYVDTDPIITHNTVHNYTISIEKKFPCFDSNICCFYSKLYNKYLLFCRANIKKGVRGIQILTSENLLEWSDFELLKLDTFNYECDNLYMTKIIELEDKKLFLGLTVYTNNDKNVTESHIKIIVSKDYINWIDYGKLIDVPIRKKCKRELKGHSTIHIAGIVRDRDVISVYFHKNYTLKNQKIMRCDYSIDDLLKN